MIKRDIYIDGACSGNPGPGGWAAITVMSDKKKKLRRGGVAYATNNSMELMAAIDGLKGCTKPTDVTFYTDSRYLITCSAHDEEWLTKETRANHELWFQFLQIAKKGKHTYKFVKVAGHSGVELNELADKYARAECRKARRQAYGTA